MELLLDEDVDFGEGLGAGRVVVQAFELGLEGDAGLGFEGEGGLEVVEGGEQVGEDGGEGRGRGRVGGREGEELEEGVDEGEGGGGELGVGEEGLGHRMQISWD